MRPLYLQIELLLRSRIASGELQAGDRLPSENRLARDFDTTRTTVRQALAKLEFERLISRHAGLGTFVARPAVNPDLDTTLRKSFEEQVEAKGHRASFRLLGFGEVIPPGRVAALLGVGPGKGVYRLERLRLVDGELVGLEERFILPRHARELPGAALHELSALNFMDLTSAAPLDSVRVTVRAALAEGVVAARLELAPGAPILVREHVFVGVQGNPVLCGDAIYRGDRYQFTYSLGAIDGTVHSAVAYLPPEDLPPEQSHARSDHH